MKETKDMKVKQERLSSIVVPALASEAWHAIVPFELIPKRSAQQPADPRTLVPTARYHDAFLPENPTVPMPGGIAYGMDNISCKIDKYTYIPKSECRSEAEFRRMWSGHFTTHKVMTGYVRNEQNNDGSEHPHLDPNFP